MRLILLLQCDSRGARAGWEQETDWLLLPKRLAAPPVSGAGAAGQLRSRYTPTQGFTHLEIPSLPPDSQPCFLTTALSCWPHTPLHSMSLTSPPLLLGCRGVIDDFGGVFDSGCLVLLCEFIPAAWTWEAGASLSERGAGAGHLRPGWGGSGAA